MNEEMKFQLSQPINVSNGQGGFDDTHELILVAPSMKDRKQVANLQQIIARAQMNFISKFPPSQLEALKNQEKSEDKEEEKDGDAIRQMIIGSDEDLENFYSCFDTLALRVCTVLDGVYLKKEHLELMAPKDYSKMCFDYIANFIE